MYDPFWSLLSSGIAKQVRIITLILNGERPEKKAGPKRNGEVKEREYFSSGKCLEGMTPSGSCDFQFATGIEVNAVASM